MRPIAIDIYGQSTQHVHQTLHAGWNSLPTIKAGVWLRNRALEFWNACLGAGELNIDRIEITFDGPVSGVLARANWHVDPARPNVLVIGTGHEWVCPRGVLTVRWDYRIGETAPTHIPYGPATVTWAANQKRDLFGPLSHALLAPRETGMWAPGVASPHKQADPPGADERNGVCGWEQDVPGMLLRSDLVMERMPIGCLDQATGMPVLLDRAHEPDYTLDTGWGRHGQLYAFCQPVMTADAPRAPIVTWPGTCSYRALMLGLDIYNSYTRFNGQHRKNALGHIIAAAQCGDESAIFFLANFANDAAMAENYGPMPRGGRDFSWRIDAWAHVRTHWRRAQKSADDVEKAVTANGGILRAPAGYGFSPDPQELGMPADWDSDQLMERDIAIYVFGLFGKIEAMKKAILGRPWPSRCKFLGVGITHGEAFPTYQHPCGTPDYYPDLGLGAWAVLEPREPKWQELALIQPVSGWSVPTNWTHYASLKERRDVMRAQPSLGREQSAMLLSVLEGMAL